MNALSAREHVDFLVLGGGVAGLTFALEAASHGSVLVVTKRQRSEGTTQYAQGGIAAVLGPDDDFDAHVEDTLVAGDGLCQREVVEVGVREGPERIRGLIALGVRVRSARPPERLRPRRARAATRAAASCTRRTSPGARSSARSSPPASARGIRIVEDHIAVDLVTSGKPALGGPNRVLGAYVLDRDTGDVTTVSARATLLATGGAGKVYLYTSNPDVATGDGIAMAYRAGAADREHGVLPVPPDLPLPPAGEELPHQRGAARRGRRSCAAPTATPFMERYDAASRARAARHRRARDRRRDEARAAPTACSST